ncbi:MAG: ABC transporter permease [Eubacterium sp.]|nr:ABC transporter permease [Eubacterium sp.]
MKSADKMQSGFLPMLKNVFRRNILFLILTQLCIFGITGLTASSFLEKKPVEVSDITMDCSGVVSILFAIFSVGVSLIVAYALYRELFSKSASDFILSMPVKREALYNANMIFGFVNIALSCVVAFGVTVFCVKSDVIFPAEFYIFDVSAFAKLLLISFLAAVSAFAIFVACATISGRKWHYFLLSYLAVAGTVDMAMGVSAYIGSIWGFTLDYNYSYIISPLSSIFISLSDKLSHIAALCIAFAVQIAVAYIAGLLAFKRRKAEVAETTVFGKILPFIIITVFLCAGASLTLNFASTFYANLLFAAGKMIIVTLIITALFYRKPFNKLTLTSLITAFAITVIFVCCVQFVPKASGYVDYVPESDEVESVTVKTGEYEQEMYGFGIFSDFVFDAFDIEDDSRPVYTLSTDEAKKAVFDLHKKMASEEAMERFYESNQFNGYDAVNGIRLEYKLKNGKTVVRSYSVNASIVSTEFADMIKTDECLNQIEPMNYGNDILFFTLTKNNDEPFDPDKDYEVEDEDLGYDTSAYDYAYAENCIQLDDYSSILESIKQDLKITENYDFMYACGFDTTCFEFGDEEGEKEYYFDDDEDSAYTLVFYKFNEKILIEDKEKLLEMTPNEMLSFDEKRRMESGYELDSYFEECVFNVGKTDKNTLSYLEKLGY